MGWRFTLARGRFLPADDSALPCAYAVLGATVAKGAVCPEEALGSLIRVGDRRFRVMGVMEPKGQFLLRSG